MASFFTWHHLISPIWDHQFLRHLGFRLERSDTINFWLTFRLLIWTYIIVKWKIFVNTPVIIEVSVLEIFRSVLAMVSSVLRTDVHIHCGPSSTSVSSHFGPFERDRSGTGKKWMLFHTMAPAKGVNKMQKCGMRKTKCGMEYAECMWLVDGNNHVTIHILHFITLAVSRVVNKMRKSRAEIVNTSYI